MGLVRERRFLFVMKKRLDSYILDTVTKTDKFKLIFVLSCFLAFYGGYGLVANNKDFFGSILISFSNIYFNLGFFLLLFVNTIYFCSWFYQYDSYLLRLKDKKMYLKHLIYHGLKFNVVWMICFLMIYFLVLFFTNLGFVQNYFLYHYGVSVWVYVIFYLVRYFLLATILSVFVISFFVIFKERKTTIFCFLFFLGYLVMPVFLLHSDEASFKLFPYSYYVLYDYGSFSLEIFYSIGYLLLLGGLLFVVFSLFLKHKQSGFSYVVKKDFSFLIFRKRFSLVLYCFVSILFFIIYLFSGVKGINLFYYSLGLKIDTNSYDFFHYIAYYFNLFFYLSLLLELFFQDYSSHLEYLMLRIDFSRFYLYKVFSLLLCTFLLLLLQYIILLLIGAFWGKVGMDLSLIFIFVVEYLFLLFIQQIVLFSTFLYYLMFPIRYVFVFMGVILFLLLPKNIFVLPIWMLFLGVFLVVGINYFLHKKCRRKIIEGLGGVSYGN